MGHEDQKPLLDLEAGTDEEWERVHDLARGEPAITMGQLIEHDPESVFEHIKAGVVKLGEFQVEDTLLLSALGDKSMLTLGAATEVIDYETVWRRRLAKLWAGPGGIARKWHARKASGWTRMVTAEAFVVRIRGAARPDKAGLIRPLLQRWQAGGCHYSAFGLPAVHAVLEFKWESFCRAALVAELLLFLTWLASYSVFMLMWQDEDPDLSLGQLWDTLAGKVTIVAEVVSLAAMAPFLLVEWSTLVAYLGGWLSVWNVLDLSTYGLQAAIAALHLTRAHLAEPWFASMVALQCVLLFFRLNYFSRLFGNKFSFLDSLKQVVVDCRFYLLFLLFMVYGFACAYCVLFRGSHDVQQFSDVSHSMLTVLNYALGGVNLNTMLDSSNPHAAMVLSVVFQFSMSMVLMNLLISLMCRSVFKSTEHEELKSLVSRAQVIDELESTLPNWVERLMPRSCFPAFVHVLRLDPKSLDALGETTNQMWRHASEEAASRARAAARERGAAAGGSGARGGGDGGGDGGGGGGGPQIADLAAQIAALRAEVATLNDLLHTAVPSLPPSPDRSPERRGGGTPLLGSP